MSCQRCEDATGVAFYRWSNANIGMVGCTEHLREVFGALNRAQASEQDTFFTSLRGMIERNVEGVSGSSAFVSIYSERMADFADDPLPALQLAIAILLDKPIVLAVLPGREPPAKLVAIADKVIYGDDEAIARGVTEWAKEHQP